MTVVASEKKVATCSLGAEGFADVEFVVLDGARYFWCLAHEQPAQNVGAGCCVFPCNEAGAGR